MYEGSCHCGNVKWKHNGPVESVTACNCSICRRYGSIWAYGYFSQNVTVSGETTAYRHAKKISGFHFCPNCGCLCYYLVNENYLDTEGRRKIAVNMRMSQDPKQIMQLPIDHFDGADTWSDLPSDGRCIKDLWF